MKRSGRMVLGVASTAAALALVAGCGSSSGSTGDRAAGRKTITIGLLTDSTGVASSAAKTSLGGLKAGVVYAHRQGYDVKYAVADTATNPATALTAAQKLVTRDHVSAVIAISALTFAASNYLTAHKVPVIGNGQDGPEWTTAKNMFSVVGALNTTKVATTTGEFFKTRGVTTFGAIGYSISPTSSEAARSASESAKAAGLKVGYTNAKFPFGSTDVSPVALAMKSAGVDGIVLYVDPNSAFALVTALRNEGVDLKAALLPTGYGGDLLQAGPARSTPLRTSISGFSSSPSKCRPPPPSSSRPI